MDALTSFYGRNGAELPEMDFNDDNDVVYVTEVYSQGRDDSVAFSQSEEDTDSIRNWIGEVSPPDSKLLVRLARIPLIVSRYPYRLDIKRESYEFLISYMGLEKYIDYSHSSSTTFDIIPTLSEGKTCGFYGSIFLVHFIGLYITYDVRTGQTRGLCWTGDKQMPRFQDCVMSLGSLAQHPYCVLLSAAATFNSYHDFRLGEVSRDVSSVEKRTGYSGWDMMSHQAAEGSYSMLSARMSGLATSLAANRRLNRLAEEIVITISSPTTMAYLCDCNLSLVLQQLFYARVVVIQRRLGVQNTHIDVLTTRVNNQLTALFNLTNRNETLLSLEIAKDSRTIASASKRDSSSMKTLAAVTVIFLPGTFVASLFSMSMFNWQDVGGDVLAPRFWIYWAVTLPLTLLTMVVWLAWTHWRATVVSAKDREGGKGLEEEFA